MQDKLYATYDDLLELEEDERCRIENEEEEKAQDDYERFIKKLEDED